jgi:hypothetical protein
VELGWGVLVGGASGFSWADGERRWVVGVLGFEVFWSWDILISWIISANLIFGMGEFLILVMSCGLGGILFFLIRWGL